MRSPDLCTCARMPSSFSSAKNARPASVAAASSAVSCAVASMNWIGWNRRKRAVAIASCRASTATSSRSPTRSWQRCTSLSNRLNACATAACNTPSCTPVRMSRKMILPRYAASRGSPQRLNRACRISLLRPVLPVDASSSKAPSRSASVSGSTGAAAFHNAASASPISPCRTTAACSVAGSIRSRSSTTRLTIAPPAFSTRSLVLEKARPAQYRTARRRSSSDSMERKYSPSTACFCSFFVVAAAASLTCAKRRSISAATTDCRRKLM